MNHALERSAENASEPSAEVQKSFQMVHGELYEDLLDRYERMLVFAGQLQEKLRSERLLADRNRDLEAENQRLRSVVAAGEAYMKVLERALGVLGLGPLAKRDLKPSDSAWE